MSTTSKAGAAVSAFPTPKTTSTIKAPRKENPALQRDLGMVIYNGTDFSKRLLLNVQVLRIEHEHYGAASALFAELAGAPGAPVKTEADAVDFVFRAMCKLGFEGFMRAVTQRADAYSRERDPDLHFDTYSGWKNLTTALDQALRKAAGL